jgi:hypothetical protein
MKCIIKNMSSAMPVDKSTGNVIICYISFRTMNFLCFLPYSFPVLHVIEFYVEDDVCHLPRVTRTNIDRKSHSPLHLTYPQQTTGARGSVVG